MTWLLARKFGPWIAAALALVAIVAWIDHRGYARGKADMVAKYQPIMDRALTNIETLKSNQRILSGALDNQNAAIAAAKADGDKRVADGKAALKQAQRANEGLSDMIGALRKSAGRKPVVGDPCVVSETLQKAGAI